MLNQFALMAALSVSTVLLMPSVAQSQSTTRIIYAPIEAQPTNQISVDANGFRVDLGSRTTTYDAFGRTRTVIIDPNSNVQSVYGDPLNQSGTVVIDRFYPRSGFGDPFYRPRGVIIAPIIQPRTVIVNPRAGYGNFGYDRGRYYGGDGNFRHYGGRHPRSSNCGSVIYGSPIPSPIPVNPSTGLACR